MATVFQSPSEICFLKYFFFNDFFVNILFEIFFLIFFEIIFLKYLIYFARRRNRTPLQHATPTTHFHSLYRSSCAVVLSVVLATTGELRQHFKYGGAVSDIAVHQYHIDFHRYARQRSCEPSSLIEHAPVIISLTIRAAPPPPDVLFPYRARRESYAAVVADVISALTFSSRTAHAVARRRDASWWKSAAVAVARRQVRRSASIDRRWHFVVRLTGCRSSVRGGDIVWLPANRADSDSRCWLMVTGTKWRSDEVTEWRSDEATEAGVETPAIPTGFCVRCHDDAYVTGVASHAWRFLKMNEICENLFRVCPSYVRQPVYTHRSTIRQGAVSLTVGSVLRGTIVNDVIFIGQYRGQPIQRPINTWRNLGLSYVGPRSYR